MTGKYFLLLMLFMTVSCQPIHAQDMDMMTFNIRYANNNDGEDKWDLRKQDVIDLINYYHPAAVGIQEGLYDQTVYIKQGLPSYKMIGVGRDDGATKGEFSSIFYDTTKLEVLSENTFWLSETPDEVSVGWDASMERICTYGLFKNVDTQKEFYIFNTHFDHRGPQARLASAHLILNMIDQTNKRQLPVILMGDLNSTPADPPIQVIDERMTDPLKSTSLYGPTGTSNNFDSATIMDRRIDYIFATGADISKYRHIDDRRPNNRMPSDHLPVMVTIRL